MCFLDLLERGEVADFLGLSQGNGDGGSKEKFVQFEEGGLEGVDNLVGVDPAGVRTNLVRVVIVVGVVELGCEGLVQDRD